MANAGNSNVPGISGMLDALEEVESYIITDKEGRIHAASSQNYNENTINSCIYLWVIGVELGSKFSMGAPINLIYYLKSKKVLIQKYQDYLIILNLTGAVKFSGFKKKLYDLFNK